MMYHRTFCWLFNIKYCVLHFEKLFNIWELELKRWYPESTKGCVGQPTSWYPGALMLFWDLCVNLRTLMPPWSLDADLGSLLLFWEPCIKFQFQFLFKFPVFLPQSTFFPVFFLHPIPFSNGYLYYLG